ncbi:hypothetical protein TUM4438_14670 [Shewanella sairae]|uniref:Uncharacterized protein n=1 Tax=Shewanella sairae TaxID=190310 RepID=A0ABQ4P9F2_9GAMM|nr:hypothetical protein [Shewanella sairae]MCL1128998.1 hypothetical protein [Shewanella sairae]GIU44140.1 hypothetical protein TUM4438_14670 [Shewanella sairae]
MCFYNTEIDDVLGVILYSQKAPLPIEVAEVIEDKSRERVMDDEIALGEPWTANMRR